MVLKLIRSVAFMNRIIITGGSAESILENLGKNTKAQSPEKSLGMNDSGEIVNNYMCNKCGHKSGTVSHAQSNYLTPEES